MPDPPARRSVEETWQRLEADGLDMPRGPDGGPLIPPAMPNYDDDNPRLSFFRGHWEDADFSALTLPRTYFARSSFGRVDFRNTDLSESRMCWNGFDFCDFRGADLSGCDLREARRTTLGREFRFSLLRKLLLCPQQVNLDAEASVTRLLHISESTSTSLVVSLYFRLHCFGYNET